MKMNERCVSGELQWWKRLASVHGFIIFALTPQKEPIVARSFIMQAFPLTVKRDYNLGGAKHAAGSQPVATVIQLGFSSLIETK